jgi:predicted NACHT family NTPase
LAAEVNLKTRQPIWRFFTGQPVDRQVFMEVCSILDLEWREIADNPPAEFPIPGEKALPITFDIETLVAQTRVQLRETIENQCGILQLLDISHPVNINDIYIDVNILKKITSQQYLAIANLKNLDLKNFDRVGLGDVAQQQIPGMDAAKKYTKLRVLGRPGVGKTTFLKHLAIQCNQGEFAPNQVPIFIFLREFAEDSRQRDKCSLAYYLGHKLHKEGVTNSSILKKLLQEGRVLLLLDGLDEVLEDDIDAVLKEIRKFCEQYYKNRFVVSCRTAAHKLQLKGFTDVEIAPFTQKQITTFAQKWFVVLAETATSSGKNQSSQFIEKLDLPENWQFRQLVVTPLFLHLACWVFQNQGKFPVKRTEFYKQGLDLLLGKWDEAKGVARDNIYRGFLLPQKIKLLSKLASVTFEQEQYFFEQTVIEHYISDYLQNLPGETLEPEELQFESEAILKAIEAQHGLLIERARGIFSFSYLAFQEYLTARTIVADYNLRALEKSLEGLVSHVTDRHWREVFLLTMAMLRSADSLVQLMKQEIDALVAEDPYLQDFLQWGSEKSQQISNEPQLVTKRAFYLALAKTPQATAHFALACTLDQGVFLDAALESLLLECSAQKKQKLAQTQVCDLALSNILVMILDVGFHKSLQQLRAQIPLDSDSRENLDQWWEEHYVSWLDQLKKAIADFRNIHHQWHFSPEQEVILQKYYEANQLLVDCLNSNAEITPAIRQEIEATMLLSQKELEDREWRDS